MQVDIARFARGNYRGFVFVLCSGLFVFGDGCLGFTCFVGLGLVHVGLVFRCEFGLLFVLGGNARVYFVYNIDRYWGWVGCVVVLFRFEVRSLYDLCVLLVCAIWSLVLVYCVC